MGPLGNNFFAQRLRLPIYLIFSSVTLLARLTLNPVVVVVVVIGV